MPTQRAIQKIIDMLLHHADEQTPVEIATNVISALGLERVGWACEGSHMADPISHSATCDQCFEVWRMRNVD